MPLEPILYAFLAAALVVGLGWRPWSSTAPGSGPWASALLLPACFAAGWAGTRGELLPFPPREGQHWVFYGGLAGAALGGLSRRPALTALGILAVAYATLRFGLGEVLARSHPATAEVLLPAFAVAAAILGESARRNARPQGAVLWLAAFALAAAIQRGTFGGAGLLLGACAVGVGGLAVASSWRPDWRIPAPAVGAMTLLLVGMLVAAWLLGDTPWLASLAAGGVLAVAWIPPGVGWRPLLRWGLPVAALAALALWDSWPAPDPYAAYR